MDKAETAAKSIIENLICGAKMHYQVNQSAGEHDFNFEYATGTCVPLEVTMSTDELAEAKGAELIFSKRGSFVLPPEITHVWVATWAGDGAWHTVWHAQRNSTWAYLGHVDIATGVVVNGDL